MRAPNKPVKLVARENLIALLNRMKRYYDKVAADCGALAEKMQTASDGDVEHLERELLSAIRLSRLAPKDLQAELEKLREKTFAPLKARQDRANEIKKRVWRLHDSGRTAQEIQGDLAAEKPPIERSLSWIYATIAERNTKS
jgi:hypothetical protein